MCVMPPDVLGDRLFEAICTGDLDAVADLYADDVVIWHNYDQVGQTKEENLRVLRWLSRNVQNLRYDDIQRHPIDDGFVQQHVLRGVVPGGEKLDVPACMVVRVSNERITRIDEYLDTAQLASLMR
jgi:uncharacterized protein